MDSLPSLLRIHHETVEALLKNHQFQQCIDLCDRLIECYVNNNFTFDSSPDMAIDNNGLSQEDSIRNNKSVKESQTRRDTQFTQSVGHNSMCSGVGREDTDKGEIMHHSGRKRKLKEISDELHTSQDCEQRGELDAVTLKFKAEALVNLNEPKAAVACLQR